MDTLNSILEEHGREILADLLRNELTITEKINGHRLIAKKRLNGKVDFFTKKSRKPLDVLDNVMSDLYADAINYILTRKDALPVGETAFYLVKNDLDVEYTDVKTQSLIVTNSENISNVKVKEIGERIGTRSQEYVFSGILLEKQIDAIIEYMLGHGPELPALMTEMFGKNAVSLNACQDDIVEGYIFCVKGELFKIQDRRFVKKEYRKINTSNYELLVLDILDMFDLEYMNNIELSQQKSDFRYLEAITKMYVDYINKKADPELSFFATLPTFSATTGKVNTKYLANEEAKNYILKSAKHEYLFRVFLQLFRRTLIVRGLISEDACEKHEMLKAKLDEKIIKTSMPTFEEIINLE